MFGYLLGRRDILALPVRCTNIERRCEWIGTVATLEEHVATCEFTLHLCPNQCDYEIKLFLREDLSRHLKEDCPNRDYTCKYCGEKSTYARITQVHDRTCPKKIITCPNCTAGCTETMQRRHVRKHVTTKCKYAVIPCKFKKFGCDAKLTRNDMARHEDENVAYHLQMATSTAAKLENELEEAKDKNVRLERELDEMRAQKSLKLKVTDFQKRKEQGLEVSRSYYTSPNGYHMALSVYANGEGDGKGTHVSVFAPIREGLYDAEIEWPFMGKVTITLLNQLEDKNHYKKTIDMSSLTEANALVGSVWGYKKFFPHSELGYDPDRNTQYLKDDILYFRMSVELPHHDKPWLA